MESKTVLVTGIGGNVAQGIVRNIRHTGYPVRCIGSNISEVSSGNHLFDVVYKTPYAYEENYIEAIIEICEKEYIDLIIPSTDYETLHLSKAIDRLPQVAVSPYETCKIFVDKYLTWLHFQSNNIPFAQSILPSKFSGQFIQYIAKPRKGRGSRGLFYNPGDLSAFDDDDYVIQELYEGTEITTAFYINRNKELLGSITFSRHLSNGTTSQCLVEFQYDSLLLNIIDRLIETTNISGPCNLQAIIDKDGQIFPFEINGRISGTNSIRSNFGFKDVKYILDEYLYNIPLEKPVIEPGAAIRVLMDVIYPGITEYHQIKDLHTHHYIF